jgi:methionyl-tRNA formyltransferase
LNDAFEDFDRNLGCVPDVIVNAHGPEFIAREQRVQAVYGAIGYHPSLLPRHRGRDAIKWTIARQDPIAGGTVYELDDGWDTGPVIAQDWCHVLPGWTASDLWREELFPMGIALLLHVVRAMSWGPEHWPATPGVPQDERAATVEPAWPESLDDPVFEVRA